MPEDSSDIDNALVAKLGGDVTLLALCPNGAYWQIAPPNSTRYVIVSLVDEVDVPEYGRTAYEDALYAIEVRMLSTVAGHNPKAAAARVHALLQDQPLTVTGYTAMTLHRESRIRQTEQDEADPSILWFRRGGHYRVQMTAT